MGSYLLQEIVIIFALAIGVLLICHRLRIPSVVGFLLTGVVCGPYGAGFISATTDVQTLAQIGIVLLLFSVGLEFSVARIFENKRYFILAGALQVCLTVLLGIGVAQVVGRPFGESIFLGFLLSLSSTAIVLRVLEKRQEISTPQGRLTVGILIFQDVAAVPMMLITPLLSKQNIEFKAEFLGSFLSGFVIVSAVFIAAIKLVPLLMHQIAKTRSRELFLLATLSICFSVAWITESAGLSLPLGAFLAGLIVSESEYRSEAVEDILPFMDVFTSFFFVSIGMLLDLKFVWENFLLIILITMGVIFMKGFVAGWTTLLIGMPLRTSILVAFALSQVGEFSFVLAQSGMSFGLGTSFNFQLFLSIAVLTMALTPSLIEWAPLFASEVMKFPLPEKMKNGFFQPKSELLETKENHVVIIGFGLPGRMLSDSCKEAKIPYNIIEIDPVIMRRELKKGEPIFFGDASHIRILQKAGVEKAAAIVVLTNDPLATMRIVEHARHLNQDAYIVARTRWNEEMIPLFQLGADEVLPDEFGASVEIFTRILRKYLVEPEKIEEIVKEKRNEGYEMLRLLFKEPSTLFDVKMSFTELGLETFKITRDSVLAGKSLKESRLRNDYGVSLIMIKRGPKTLLQLDENTIIQAEDLIVVLGHHELIKRLRTELFE